MRGPGFHEYKRARLHGPIILAVPEAAAALQHIVYFVLGMRLLGVFLAGGEVEESQAQGIGEEELVVAVTARTLLLNEVLDSVSFHIGPSSAGYE
jgi:hypothetical protein